MTKLPKGFIDQYYIDAYLEKPKAGKTKALRVALNKAGIEGMSATKQRAYEIHNRLRDQIEEQLIRIAKDCKAIGLNKLIDLCENADSENVQLSAATTLTKDLFPHVSIKKVETIDDIDNKLEALEREINETTGHSIN